MDNAGLVARLRRRMHKPDGTKRRPSPRELEAADAIERLKGYATHKATCEDRGAYPGSCTCGLSRLLKEIGDG